MLAPPRSETDPAGQQETLLEQIVAPERERASPPQQPRGNDALPGPDQPETLSLLDLLVLCRDVERLLAAPAAPLAIEPDVTVAGRIGWLRSRLARWPESPSDLDSLLAAQDSRPAQACLFLALLELAKRHELLLDQLVPFGTVTIAAASRRYRLERV